MANQWYKMFPWHHQCITLFIIFISLNKIKFQHANIRHHMQMSSYCKVQISNNAMFVRQSSYHMKCSFILVQFMYDDSISVHIWPLVRITLDKVKTQMFLPTLAYTQTNVPWTSSITHKNLLSLWTRPVYTCTHTRLMDGGWGWITVATVDPILEMHIVWSVPCLH